MGCTWWPPPILDSALLLLLLFLLLSSECVGFVVSLRHVSVEMGDEVVLSCRVPRDNIPVEWTKLPRANSLLLDKRVSITRKLNTSQLHLKNTSWTDTSTYQCNRSDSGKVLSTTRLTVTCKRNVGITVSSSLYATSEVVVREGDNLQLNCNINIKGLYVTWRIKNRNQQQTIYAGRKLEICNVQIEDAGVYECTDEVENKTLTQVHLLVQYSPVIVAPWLHVLQAVNYTSELQCIIDAFPVAQITWFKEDTPINDTERYRFTNQVNHHVTETTLVVINTERSDYGNYTCVARNEIGFAALTLKLAYSLLPVRKRKAIEANQDTQTKPSFTGFVLGMLPPLCISFYIILHLGFRSRYAEERPEEEGGDGLDEIVGEQAFKMSSG